MSRCFLLFLVLLLVASNIMLVGTAYEEVSGIITSDTTWIKANSPYNLTGNLAVDSGVTLTVEAGVTVNLNEFFIRVNGTLVARGTSADQIRFEGGSIVFSSSSSGSVIENAIINCRIATGGSSPVIHNNTITKSMSVGGGSPIISKNTIAVSGSDWFSNKYGITFSSENTAQLVDNIISGEFEYTAIDIQKGSPKLQRKIISNSYGYAGHANYWQSGISIAIYATPIIENNTITRCANGISLKSNQALTIIYNNFERISNYNLKVESSVSIDASNNWWGTTDTAVISEKMHDFDDNFDLGKVNYTLILAASNPQAKPDPNAPIPTQPPDIPASPTPVQTATTEPSFETGDLFGFSWARAALTVMAVAVAILALAVIVLWRKVASK